LQGSKKGKVIAGYNSICPQAPPAPDPSKATSRRLSVRRIVRLLRGRTTGREEGGVVGVSSLQARRVFGVLLTEHLVHAG
jgi:hypothetical protein